METLWRHRILLGCDSGGQPLPASQLLVSTHCGTVMRSARPIIVTCFNKDKH